MSWAYVLILNSDDVVALISVLRQVLTVTDDRIFMTIEKREKTQHKSKVFVKKIRNTYERSIPWCATNKNSITNNNSCKFLFRLPNFVLPNFLPTTQLHSNRSIHFDRNKMIKAILVFNNHGRPRLSKFYQYFVSESNFDDVRKNA